VRVRCVGLGMRAWVGPAVGFGRRVGTGVQLRVRDRHQHCEDTSRSASSSLLKAQPVVR